jgi:glycerophosphoryl diester phosphodiesterase
MIRLPKESPLIIAHRGFRARYPENTMAAFQAAVDFGAPMLELDVRLSRDRKMVVIHDAHLERTTNGKGLVSEHTLEQLLVLDAGAWFDLKFTGERVPTLETVFDGLGEDILINVEVKPDLLETDRPKDAIEPLLRDLIRSMGRLETVLVSSFEPRILENLRILDAHINLAFLSDLPMTKETVALCRDLKCISCHPNLTIADQKGIDMMHAEDILVFPFTVNTTADYKRLMGYGVDGIITDDPTKFIEK